MLVIYGADAAAGAGNPDHQGFLDMDHIKQEDYGLGGPAMVLPIIAYFISRNDSSKGLGGMIFSCRYSDYNWRCNSDWHG